MSSSVGGGRELGGLVESPRLFGRDRELALIRDLFEHIGAGGRSPFPTAPGWEQAISPTLSDENGGNG